jgi:uncharacterized membrane protein YcaP (DUF421 family)
VRNGPQSFHFWGVSMGAYSSLKPDLFADASQNGMAGEYKTVSEACVLIGTIAAWDLWIDRMSYHFGWFARFAAPRIVPLIRHGKVIQANLRREMLTVEDFEAKSARIE